MAPALRLWTKAVLLVASELPARGALVDQLVSGDWIVAATSSWPPDSLDRLSSDRLVMVVTWIAAHSHLCDGLHGTRADYARFFGYLNLFTGAMLILVLGDSLPVTFIGWEGVGLASYLLIGFWYQEDRMRRRDARRSSSTASATFGFLLGICLLFTVVGTVTPTLAASGPSDDAVVDGWPVGCWIAILLFCRLCGQVGADSAVRGFLTQWLVRRRFRR